MRGTQLDLFAATGILPASLPQPKPGRPEPVPADLDDAAVIEALPRAGMAEAAALAAEAGRRRPVAAVPALERLCRRFAGFGRERAVPEQVAALRALALIGGAEAARAVARLIAEDAVQGPTRKVAVETAARLGSALPAGTVLAPLRDADPDVRAAACRCTGAWPAVVPVLLALTDDGDCNVSVAALCALGRLGRREAGPALARLLRDAPAVAGGHRVDPRDRRRGLHRPPGSARPHPRPALAGAALGALGTIDHPRARQIAAALDAGRSG